MAARLATVPGRARAGFLIAWAASVAAGSPATTQEAGTWRTLAPGFEIGRFRDEANPGAADASITVLRIDPHRWELTLLCAAALGSPSLTSREWCEKHKLAAVTNAGMFAMDGRSHVGHLRDRSQVHTPAWNNYMSVAAFDPRRPGLAPFRIFDLDVTARDAILADYHAVVQNLRLIQRPGVNRWSQQPKQWSEAALGEDADGNLLVICARTPYSMHDLNRALLRLPIRLVAAQHLEGGPEAQAYLRIDDFEYVFMGSYETGFNENDGNLHQWPIPNALGVRARAASETR